MAGCLRSRGWVSWLLVIPLALGVLIVSGGPAARAQGLGAPGLAVQEYAVAAGSHPHDAVPDGAGGVWYTGQGDGTVGRLDPATGDYKTVDLGQGSAPHGVIMGPDKAVWVTDGGLNAIVRIDPDSLQAQVFPLPGPRYCGSLGRAVTSGGSTRRSGSWSSSRRRGARGRMGSRRRRTARSTSPRWPAATWAASTATTAP